MSDEKRTINVDGLSGSKIDVLEDVVDALKDGRGMWFLEDSAYASRMNECFDKGAITALISTGIATVIVAIAYKNQDKIASGLSNAAKFIFGKKK